MVGSVRAPRNELGRKWADRNAGRRRAGHDGSDHRLAPPVPMPRLREQFNKEILVSAASDPVTACIFVANFAICPGRLAWRLLFRQKKYNLWELLDFALLVSLLFVDNLTLTGIFKSFQQRQ